MKAVEALARKELEAVREDDPRTFLWDPLPEICVYLQIARSRLSQFTKELTGLAAHEIVDRIRAERLKERLRVQLRAFVAANRGHVATGRAKFDSRSVQLCRLLRRTRQTPEFSRETWAIELGFANYRRLYRACLVLYRTTPVQLEWMIIEELLKEAAVETPVAPEVQVLQAHDTEVVGAAGAEVGLATVAA